MNENRITSSISAFFTIYLINERGLSINTIKSYRDTFILFFRFDARIKTGLVKWKN